MDVEVTSKLRNAGYVTVEAVAVTLPREIVEKTELEFDAVLDIQEAARKLFTVDFKTAKEAYEQKKMHRCRTGSVKLDGILGGGMETQALTELIGQYGSGKTQICLTLSVTAQLPFEKGGLEGNVAFIDTEGTFTPERVYQIAAKMGLDPAEAANNILTARAYNSSHQCLLIDHLFKVCPENKVKLIVVDSMISHFRGEYVGREALSERQQHLNEYLHKLIRLSEAYNLAVVITNQVISNPAQFWGNPENPTGGHVMAHAYTHRVYLLRGSKGVRLARIIDSPYLPEESAKFLITERGIEDAPEDSKADDGEEA